ncbi:Eco57I restriction-modification methylase domain-containing protein [Pectobacterium aroidearum]|uniref:Eco57I restriction-modification methylase domain-containing protein n=1 Tax=Pectobacterium aroidearum TaxID=1201031 RepID=UPI0033071CBC
MTPYKNTKSIIKNIIINFDDLEPELTNEFDYEYQSTIEDISEEYFSKYYSTEEKLNLGVVETPPLVSFFMVDLVFKQWMMKNSISDASDIHWFDPCGGSGIFPLKIYEYYIKKLGAKTEAELPYITISEVSGLGALSIAKSILIYLKSNNFDVSRLIDMNKIKVINIDTLMYFSYFDDLINNQKFDIVIGNPPYVRSTRIAKEYKRKLKVVFDSNYSGDFDLYHCFIMMGVNVLNENGFLSFISPASFIRARSANKLRKWLCEKVRVNVYIDLDECNVFSNAEVHAAIYIFGRNKGDVNESDYLHIKNNQDLSKMLTGSLKFNKFLINRNQSHGWSFYDSLASLESTIDMLNNTIPMSELGVKVYSGIRTGFSKAYIFPENEGSIFSHEIDDLLIRSIILPANIIRWHGYKKMNKLLFIPYGMEVNNTKVLEYLEMYRDRLSSRSEAKNNFWYALRTCSYYDEMFKRKIAFPDLSVSQRFSLVEENILIPDGAYFLNTDNYVVLGILNSSLAKKYFVNHCSSVGNLNSKGRFRFKKEFVKRFPLPKNVFENGVIQKEIECVVEKIIKIGDNEELSNKVNELVTRLYQEKND